MISRSLGAPGTNNEWEQGRPEDAREYESRRTRMAGIRPGLHPTRDIPAAQASKITSGGNRYPPKQVDSAALG